MRTAVRKARKTDFDKVFKLIVELAHFEKLKPPSNSAKKQLFKDSFGKKRKNNILTAVSGNDIVGYAFYFFTYSSFLAKKTLYLEDIYISQNFRSKGIGRLIFLELVKTAKREKCGRLEWCVLDWNKNAIKFYDKLGAKPLNDWIYYRMNINSGK